MIRRLEPIPSTVTGELGRTLRAWQRTLEQEVVVSAFSGETPESRLTDVPGALAANVGSEETQYRLWQKWGGRPSTTSWYPLVPGSGGTGGSSGTGAPTDAQYVTLALNGSLTAERVLSVASGLAMQDGGANSRVTLTVSNHGHAWSDISGVPAFSLSTHTHGLSTLSDVAPADIAVLVVSSNATLTAERVFSATSGLVFTAGSSSATVSLSSHSHAWGDLTGVPSFSLSTHTHGLSTLSDVAPADAQYVVLASNATLTVERVLTAGSGISFTDNGAGGTLVITNTGGAGGAPTNAQYLVLAANGTLSDERVLTAGSGISFTDAGPGGALTITNTASAGLDSRYTSILLSADTGTTTNASMQSVNDLSFAVSANSTYKFVYSILYRTQATTTGLRLGLMLPSTTAFGATARLNFAADGAGGEWQGALTDSNDSVVGTGVVSTASVYYAEVAGLVTPSSAGSLGLKYASEVNASRVSLLAGTCGQVWVLG